MRLVAGRDGIWSVYHAEECRVLKFVVWVDDEMRQWAEASPPLSVDMKGDIVYTTHQARRIDILPAHRLVIINPVEDQEPDATPCAESAGQPACAL